MLSSHYATFSDEDTVSSPRRDISKRAADFIFSSIYISFSSLED
jgi:hypothetical protein